MEMGHIKNKVEGTNSVGGQVDLSKSKKRRFFNVLQDYLSFDGILTLKLNKF